MKKVLLVEDESPKRNKLSAFISGFGGVCEICGVAKSARSAVEMAMELRPDIIILDMSLPTFDVGEEESGGRPQGFGGIEVLRHLENEEYTCDVIVVSAYGEFSQDGKNSSLDALIEEIEEKFPDYFRGLVTYNAIHVEWQEHLGKKLGELCS